MVNVGGKLTLVGVTVALSHLGDMDHIIWLRNIRFTWSLYKNNKSRFLLFGDYLVPQVQCAKLVLMVVRCAFRV